MASLSGFLRLQGSPILAILNGGITYTKHQNEMNWIVATLFFGPYITLALALSSDLTSFGHMPQDFVIKAFLKKIGKDQDSSGDKDSRK